ncbi:lytic transglycosylase domain-containing protein [Geofilum sp. OHC36d9]|uniref:lytic transglycosylase domain-containing protein n=1 Tax=Geofilum sp. OHC36d9 TaxID=3458413 RepID=UPI00403321D2
MNLNFRFARVKIWSAFTTAVIIFFVFTMFVNSSDPDAFVENASTEAFVGDNYRIQALPMPSELSFAGEHVPIERTYVSESYDRELLVNTYWQSQTLLLIKRANRYFPIIEPILKEQGVPDDFKYLPLIESGFVERIVSPAGAAGLWQFLSATAKEYGLEVNNEVDERYHIEKSTVAACLFLKKSYERFGSWTMAAASYNAGARGINRQIDKQKVVSYYDLLLSEETSRYVFRILALKSIFSAPEEYGFYLDDEDLYPVIPTYDVVISGAIADFADFATGYGTTYREFKDLNPWLRENYLTNSTGKEYILKMPEPDAFLNK